jgi:hypothetical protein
VADKGMAAEGRKFCEEKGNLGIESSLEEAENFLESASETQEEDGLLEQMRITQILPHISKKICLFNILVHRPCAVRLKGNFAPISQVHYCFCRVITANFVLVYNVSSYERFAPS